MHRGSSPRTTAYSGHTKGDIVTTVGLSAPMSKQGAPPSRRESSLAIIALDLFAIGSRRVRHRPWPQRAWVISAHGRGSPSFIKEPPLPLHSPSTQRCARALQTALTICRKLRTHRRRCRRLGWHKEDIDARNDRHIGCYKPPLATELRLVRLRRAIWHAREVALLQPRNDVPGAVLRGPRGLRRLPTSALCAESAPALEPSNSSHRELRRPD